MRTIFYLRAAALVVAVAAMSGCGKEFSPADEPGEALRTVTLCLSTAPLEDAAEEATRGGEMPLRVEAEGIEGVDVRLVPSDTEATRSVSNVDEYKISDVWVIQLNSAGTARLTAPQYISTVTNNTATARLDPDPCRLYVIANTHNSTLFSSVTTASQIESSALTLTAESSLAAGNTLPMFGYFSGTVRGAATVAMTRAVAKLTVNVTAANTIKSVNVRKVPKTLYRFRNPSALDPGTTAANCYPATSGQFFDEYASLGATGWCYLPANARGKGTSTDQKTKTAATALGGASGQGNYATYLEVMVGDDASGLSATLIIYPGANNTSDYNLLPNRSYTCTITIPAITALSGDGRVSELSAGNGWTLVGDRLVNLTLTGGTLYEAEQACKNAGGSVNYASGGGSSAGGDVWRSWVSANLQALLKLPRSSDKFWLYDWDHGGTNMQENHIVCDFSSGNSVTFSWVLESTGGVGPYLCMRGL